MNSTLANRAKSSSFPDVLVSIIIPAHNAEKWIERCIASALDQTYTNIEIIVIENGSSDHTLNILNRITDKHLRIFQSEKGVSNARNKGIDEARGQYLTFLDADDWLEEDAIEKLISVIDKNVDIVSARYFGDKPFEHYKSKKYDSGSNDYILKCLYTPTKRGNSTGNLYRTAFIKENDVRFDPYLSHAEDSVFFVGLLMKDPIVVDLEEPIYHVYINPESATRKKINIDSFCSAIRTVYKLLEGRDDDIINGGYVFALNQLLVILVNMQVNKKQIAAISTIEEFNQAIIRSDLENVPLGRKVVFDLLKMKMYNLVFFAIFARQLHNTFLQRKSRRQ